MILECLMNLTDYSAQYKRKRFQNLVQIQKQAGSLSYLQDTKRKKDDTEISEADLNPNYEAITPQATDID